MTEYARAIWIGVTAMPCPMGTVPIVDPDHWSTGSAKPADSPGKSIPVLFPKPKRSIHDASLPSPSRWAIVIVPMFEEYSTIWRTVIRSVPRVCASRIVRSATLSVGGRTERRPRIDDPFLEPRSDGHELERRSGLVGVGDGPVPSPVGTRRREPVGVEARRGRHREDRARLRIHHDRRAPPARPSVEPSPAGPPPHSPGSADRS